MRTLNKFLLPGLLLVICAVTVSCGRANSMSASSNPTAPLIKTSPTPPPGGLSSPTGRPSPTSTTAPSPTPTPVVFDVGKELTIDYLRSLPIRGSEITFEERLANGYNYKRHLVSYRSEGYRIYGLLTIPFEKPPQQGYQAIVFNHGYIPPATYRTTERYEAYVDYLARNGFVVFKIDYRGHGDSEGEPTGAYFSPGYTIDAVAAVKSLQRMEEVDPEGIGMWGHSMGGNLLLRAMLIEPEIQAGVIWSGAVYSYDDFMRYGIDDFSYRPPATPEGDGDPDPRRGTREIINTYGSPGSGEIYWKAVSLTENIGYLENPIQLHHAEDDPVVTINYSYELAAALQENSLAYELYTYPGGGHNLISPYFDQAMIRTVQFFKDNL